jgi:GTPase involved in cell partitioning and DNA repair
MACWSHHAQVREELRMYNPEYCTRPHVVVLNKMDLQVRCDQGLVTHWV